jgi:hypothetical protein
MLSPRRASNIPLTPPGPIGCSTSSAAQTYTTPRSESGEISALGAQDRFECYCHLGLQRCYRSLDIQQETAVHGLPDTQHQALSRKDKCRADAIAPRENCQEGQLIFSKHDSGLAPILRTWCRYCFSFSGLFEHQRARQKMSIAKLNAKC